MVESHLRQRIPQKPAGTRDTTKQAAARSPVQADNEGRGAAKFFIHCWKQTRPRSHSHQSSFFPPPGGKTRFEDILLTMSVQNLKGLTLSEVGTKIRAGTRHLIKDARVWENPSDSQQQGHKSKLIVFRLLLDLSNLNQGGFLHDCTSESGAVPELVVRCRCFTSYIKSGSDGGESRWCLFPVYIQTAWVWNEIQYLGAVEFLGVVMVS